MIDSKQAKQALDYILCRLDSDETNCEVQKERNKVERCLKCNVPKSVIILEQFLADCEDKETPKKPIWVRANEHITVDDHELSCPYCKKAIRFDFIAPKYRPKRCEWCGQMLDWSEEKND